MTHRQRSLVQIQPPQPVEVKSRQGVSGYQPLAPFVCLCTSCVRTAHHGRGRARADGPLALRRAVTSIDARRDIPSKAARRYGSSASRGSGSGWTWADVRRLHGRRTPDKYGDAALGQQPLFYPALPRLLSRPARAASTPPTLRRPPRQAQNRPQGSSAARRAPREGHCGAAQA
jgi:hypothetical protein